MSTKTHEINSHSCTAASPTRDKIRVRHLHRESEFKKTESAGSTVCPREDGTCSAASGVTSPNRSRVEDETWRLMRRRLKDGAVRLSRADLCGVLCCRIATDGHQLRTTGETHGDETEGTRWRIVLVFFVFMNTSPKPDKKKHVHVADLSPTRRAHQW